MADDTLQAGSDTIATDHVTSYNGGTVTQTASSPKVQRVKVGYGIDGTYDDVTSVNPLPVIDTDTVGSGTITTTDLVVAAPAGAGAFVTGTSTAGSYVGLACPGGDSAWIVQVTGLTSGTLYFEESIDATAANTGNWISVNARRTGIVNTQLGSSATANGFYRGNTSGAKWFRVRSVGTLTGTPAIQIRHSSGAGAVFLNASIPAGTNNIGLVTASNDTARTAVSINYNATAPPTTDALLSTLVLNKGATNTTGQTSIAVTAGKVLRLTAVMVSTRATVATLPYGQLTIRVNHTAAAVLASPAFFQVPVAGTAAVIGNAGVNSASIPEGFDLSGTMQLALSYSGNLATNVVAVSLLGYEFSP